MEALGLLDLAVSLIPRLSPREKALLARACETEAGFFALGRLEIELALGRPLRGALWDAEALAAQAAQTAEACRRLGVGWVSLRDPGYPPLLRETWDPPLVLFYRGALPDPQKPLLAVVGTRRPSGEGLREAYTLARDCARAGVGIVSGLALGVDALAHRGAVEGGGPTAAVLASGLDRVYPASNRPLARRIVEQGGALISEYPPGAAPERWHFPARNRIIAGLARGTALVEAPERSGALITARYALEQGRDLWVCARGLASPQGAGLRLLHAAGAPAAASARDILADWGF